MERYSLQLLSVSMFTAVVLSHSQKTVTCNLSNFSLHLIFSTGAGKVYPAPSQYCSHQLGCFCMHILVIPESYFKAATTP